MKLEQVRKLIQERKNAPVEDTCSLVGPVRPGWRRCYNAGCGYTGYMSPCPKCQTPTVNVAAVPNPMSEREDDPVPPRSTPMQTTGVPTAVRITWKKNDDGTIEEIRTPIKPVKCIGFHSPFNRIGATEGV